MDQRPEHDRQQAHERQITAVGGDDTGVAAAQRPGLAQPPAPHRGGRGARGLRASGHDRDGLRAGDVLLADRRTGEFAGPVPVRVALEGLEHLGPARLAEVAQALLRWPVERDPAPGHQYEEPVADIEVSDAMGDHDDGAAVVREVAHLLHDGFVEPRVETRRGLVQEQQRWLGEQFQGHVDPLELAARQPVGAGLGVPGQAQLAHDLIDTGVALPCVRVTGESQLSGVPQRPLGGQLGVHHAVLRDQPDPVPQLRVVLVQVTVVVQDDALVGGAHPGQRAEQSGLARATGADDAEQAPLGDREAYVVQQDLAPADLDDQILRDQRNVAGIKVFPQLAVGQPECGVPDADDIFLGKRGGGNTLPIDKCAIVTVQVNNLVLSVAGFAQFSVMPGDTEVGKDEVVVRRPANTQPAGGQGQHRGRAPVDAQPVVVRLGFAVPAAPAATGPQPGAVAVRPAPRATVAGRPAVAVTVRAVLTGHAGRGGFGADLDRRSRRSRRGTDRATAVIAEHAGTGGGRGYFRRRVHRAGGRLTAQERAVGWITEPDNAVRANSDALYTLGSDKRPIRASEVLKYPGVLFVTEDRVVP